MESQMSDDGSLLSVSQVELPVLPGGQLYQTAPVPQRTAGAAGNAAGNEVQVYSRGTLVKQCTVLSGEMIASGTNNSMYISSGGTATATTVNSSGWLSVTSRELIRPSGSTSRASAPNGAPLLTLRSSDRSKIKGQTAVPKGPAVCPFFLQ